MRDTFDPDVIELEVPTGALDVVVIPLDLVVDVDPEDMARGRASRRDARVVYPDIDVTVQLLGSIVVS